MTALAAIAPILAVLLALVLGRSARTAALAGLLVAVPVVWTLFPVPGAQLLAVGRDWLPVTVEVVLILGGGIAFAEAGRRTGVQGELSAWLVRALGSGLAPVLAIVHGFTPLIESLTGYGIGAALAVPLLCSLGLPGRRAATIGLLGLCTVPWGSMGPGTLIASQLSGVGFDALGVTTALFNLPVVLGAGVVAALLGSARGTRLRRASAGLASGLFLWGAVLGVNLLVGTALAGALGGLLTLLGHCLLRALGGHSLAVTRATGAAAVPYAIILLGMLLATVGLRAAGLADAPAAAVLGSPACWLFLATGLLLAARREHLRPVLSGAARMWARVAPSTVCFIALGALMGASGMTIELAHRVAALGPAALALIPIIAAFGGFLTGSNSGANALAAGAQADLARSLGVDLAAAMGAHNAGAAAAIMSAPARVELATQLARVPEARGAVQRQLLLVVGVAVGLMGAACLALL